MKTQEEIRLLTRALFERDLADLAIDATIDNVPLKDSISPELWDLMTCALREIGPKLFESGFYAGCNAGLEIAQEIYRG